MLTPIFEGANHPFATLPNLDQFNFVGKKLANTAEAEVLYVSLNLNPDLTSWIKDVERLQVSKSYPSLLQGVKPGFKVMLK